MNFKNLLHAVLLLTFLPAIHASCGLTAYSIRSLDIDSSKFQRIHEDYVASERRKASLPRRKLSILEKISGSRYLARITPGRKRGDKLDDQIVAVDAEPGRVFAAGDRVELAIDDTGEIVSCGVGEKRDKTARLFRVRSKNPLSLKVLYYFLQSDGTVLVEKTIQIRCQTCRGFEKVSDYSKNAAPDRKKPCIDCREGHVNELKTFQLKW